jgi:hypothetical protein
MLERPMIRKQTHAPLISDTAEERMIAGDKKKKKTLLIFAIKYALK